MQRFTSRKRVVFSSGGGVYRSHGGLLSPAEKMQGGIAMKPRSPHLPRYALLLPLPPYAASSRQIVALVSSSYSVIERHVGAWQCMCTTTGLTLAIPMSFASHVPIT